MDAFLLDMGDYFRDKRKRESNRVRPVNWKTWKHQLEFKEKLLYNFKHKKSVITPGLEKYIDLSKMCFKN